jgi:hypothetical protein
VGTVGYDYAVDDTAVIVKNRFTQEGLAGIPDLLATPYWYGADESYSNSYRPLSLISFAIEEQLFGGRPAPSHLINVLLYSLTGVLLYIVLSRLIDSPRSRIPLIATLLFIAHPLHTEVVANIKSRDELLAFAFSLLALLAAHRAITRPGPLVAVASGVLFFLALLSKESALTFLAVVPVTLYFFTAKRARPILTASLPLLAGTVLYFLMRFHAIGGLVGMDVEGLDNPVDSVFLASDGLADRISTGLHLLGKYLFLLILPYRLIYHYTGQLSLVGFDHPAVLLTAVLVVVSVVCVARGYRARGLVSFVIAYFFITYSIVSNIPVVIVGQAMAERYLYAPSLGFCLLAAVGLERLGRIRKGPRAGDRVRTTLVNALIVLVLIGYSARAVARAAQWRDTYTLVSHDILYAPQNPHMVKHLNVAATRRLEEEKNPARKTALLEETHRLLEPSLRIHEAEPRTSGYLGAVVYNALANVDRESGRLGEALSNYNKAVALDPTNYRGFLHRGMILDEFGEYDRAIESYRLAIAINEDYDTAYYNLGNTYTRTGDYPAAIDAFESAIAANPDYAKAFANLGIVLRHTGDATRAEAMIREAIRLDPALAGQLQ